MNNSSFERNVDYFSSNVRMGMATAAALEAVRFLGSAHVDFCITSGWSAGVLQHIAGPRVKNRIVNDIPMSRIHRHPQLALISRARWARKMAGRDAKALDHVLGKTYSAIARQCSSDAVVGTQNASLELFAGRKYRILEQISHPLRYHRAVAAEEAARFPEWAPDSAARLSDWDHRMEQEWQEADLIWVPASRLIAASKEYGADPAKFRVVPYPIAGRVPLAKAKEFSGHERMRVIFAGMLTLEKGVQYIYEALRRRPDLPVQVDFFGQSRLTPLGLSRLAEVGAVHGAVPRWQLLEQFRSADVLLFPSLSEGSALVTLEATGLGLPVIATEEAGAPSSAMTVPARDPDAIVDALERLSDERALLRKHSEMGLAEAARRDYASYTSNIADSVANL